jgi:hypothetical protein
MISRTATLVPPRLNVKVSDSPSRRKSLLISKILRLLSQRKNNSKETSREQVDRQKTWHLWLRFPRKMRKKTKLKRG